MKLEQISFCSCFTGLNILDEICIILIILSVISIFIYSSLIDVEVELSTLYGEWRRRRWRNEWKSMNNFMRFATLRFHRRNGFVDVKSKGFCKCSSCSSWNWELIRVQSAANCRELSTFIHSRLDHDAIKSQSCAENFKFMLQMKYLHDKKVFSLIFDSLLAKLSSKWNVNFPIELKCSSLALSAFDWHFGAFNQTSYIYFSKAEPTERLPN